MAIKYKNLFEIASKLLKARELCKFPVLFESKYKNMGRENDRAFKYFFKEVFVYGLVNESVSTFSESA